MLDEVGVDNGVKEMIVYRVVNVRILVIVAPSQPHIFVIEYQMF
jgi:hypothetical protein